MKKYLIQNDITKLKLVYRIVGRLSNMADLIKPVKRIYTSTPGGSVNEKWLDSSDN